MFCSLAFIEGLGGPELMMIMFIALLLFGADKLPGLAKGLGKTVREFKKAANDVQSEVHRAMETPDEPPHENLKPATPAADAMGLAPADASLPASASVDQSKIAGIAKH